MVWENINQSDAKIAKNYLNEEELGILNRFVSMYLEFAELQALNKKPMYMKDWSVKLDDFLRLVSPRDILFNTGKISRQTAIDKAGQEYQKYQKQLKKDNVSLIEKHFLNAVKEIESIENKS